MSHASPSGRDGPQPGHNVPPIQWAFVCMISLALVAMVAGAASAAEIPPQSLLTGGPMAVDTETPTETPAEADTPTTTATATGTPTATPAITPSTTTLTPIADANLYIVFPTTNSGAAPSAPCGAAYATITNGLPCLFRFDLSSIAAGARIQSATLRLYSTKQEGPESASYSIYALRRGWSELGVDWQTTDGLTAWGVAGAESTVLDREGMAGATATLFGSPAHWSEIDLTLLVQRWVSGDLPNRGIKLQKVGGAMNNMTVAMKEGGDVAPQLVVVWSPPAPPTPTATSTVTPTPTEAGTATETGTPTTTATSSGTLTPTMTRTATATRTASATATPTLDPAYSHAVTFRQGLEPSPTFMGCADATLVQYEPDYPHTPANIYLRPPDYIEKTGIQQWDLAPWIPAWSVISSARLNLYAVHATNPGNIAISLYPVRRSWVASWVTWNRPNDLQDELWSVPGAKGIGSDTGPAAASFTLEGTGRWYSVDITALAQKWVARPGNNHGVLLRVSGATAQTEYEVAGCQAPAALRAYLEISYNDYYPGNTPTATSTPTTIPPLPGTPTFTKTPRPTFTRTHTATFTSTPSATVTTTGTATATPTISPTATETATDTRTPKPTWTGTVTATATATHTATATQTPTPIPSLILHFPLIVSDYAPGG